MPRPLARSSSARCTTRRSPRPCRAGTRRATTARSAAPLRTPGGRPSATARAASIRVPTTADPSGFGPGARALPARPAASRSTGRSGRAAGRRRAAGSARARASGQLHGAIRTTPAKPHGHGFIAATSWKRAGNVVARPAREIATRPSSSGWRSASSTSRSNSGSSSRNSTPWSARVTSPGDRCGPPPTIAAYDSVWCGARNGGRRRKLARWDPRRRPTRRRSRPAPARRRAAAAGPGSSARAASCPSPAAR